MEEIHTKMADEEYEEPVVYASLSSRPEERNVFKEQDPFLKGWDILKGLNGLDQNFRRRTNRNFEKAQQDVNVADATNSMRPYAQDTMKPYLDSASANPKGQGAESKQLNPGLVYRNGYGIFDVITPPYNLYELANFYDTSFANHAAIDAKVENIVGLGYSFVPTDRTMLSFEIGRAHV